MERLSTHLEAEIDGSGSADPVTPVNASAANLVSPDGRMSGVIDGHAVAENRDGTIVSPGMNTAFLGEMAPVWEEYKQSERVDLRNQLVEKYMPIVKYNAERICARLPEHVDVDDLISAGTLGLMDAIDAFDLSRGIQFNTYCVPRIRGSILDEIRTTDWVPRLVRAQASKIEGAITILNRALGRDPTPEELAGQLEMSVQELERIQSGLHSAPKLISLSAKFNDHNEGDGRDYGDLYSDTPDPAAQDPSRRIEGKEDIAAILAGCDQKERLIALLYAGEELTMKEIGEEHLGLSESRVSQTRSALIKRLMERIRDGRRGNFKQNGFDHAAREIVTDEQLDEYFATGKLTVARQNNAA